MLDINNYLSLEKKAYTELPNRFIEAFRPIVFQEIGYPVNITKEEECKKYIDVMHERRFERYHSLFGGLTESEFVLYKKAIQHVGEFCERNYNSRVLPKASMLNALNGYTQLRRLFSNEASNDGPVTIFELGGGSGYQGLLTFLGGGGGGGRYIGTDVTAAFYICQNRLWNFIAGKNFSELADCQSPVLAIEEGMFRNQMIHIPWWKLWEMRNISKLSVDIVFCDHALCEMHDWSLKFYLVLCKRLLKESQLGFFCFCFPGSQRRKSVEKLLQQFTDYGYQLLYRDHLFTVFGLRDESDKVKQLIECGIKKKKAESKVSPEEIKKLFEEATPSDDDLFGEYINHFW